MNRARQYCSAVVTSALIGSLLAQAVPSLAATLPSSGSGGAPSASVAKGLPDNGAYLAPQEAPPAVPVGDEIITGLGDASGWHVYAASGGDGWQWHALATLLPGGNDDEGWIGQQCLTGDGQHVIVVVAPYHAANSESGMNRGALAYVIDAHNGAVRPVAAGISLAYFNPGCGRDSTFTLTSYPASNYSQTRVTVFDGRSARALQSVTVKGEVTSAVSIGGRMYGAYNHQLLLLTGPAVQSLVQTTGAVFGLHPNGSAGIDFLSVNDETVEVWTWQAGTARRVGLGKRTEVALVGGRGGRNLVSGASMLSTDATMRALPGALAPGIEAASLDGTEVLLKHPRGVPSARTKGTTSLIDPVSMAAIARVLPSARHQATTAVPATDVGFALAPRNASVITALTPNTSSPTCAVPRNDLWNQVPQPNSSQINWAIQMGARGWLVSSNIPARPNAIQNYKIKDSTALSSYYPDTDFPPPTISGNSGVAVPPQVLYGIFATESNWNQASWHAIAGYGGNPLIANYYGSSNPANPTDINYDNADCAYGVGQITDIMKTTSTGVTANQQVAAAVDYGENVAVAIQTLITKWNQLASLGDSMNNGDARMDENWYGAIWAYNSGVHLGDPGYGLGWFNNPDNAQWDPNRPPFLRTSYNDANIPSRWPYQERVFGWMETPQNDPNGGQRYVGTTQRLNIPPFKTFCSPTVNSCNPNAVYPNDPCPNENYTCYWNQPVTWVNCASACASEVFTYGSPGSEPAWTSRSGSCATNSGLPAPLPGGSLLVDDTFLASQNSGLLDPNVIGCPTTPAAASWTRNGAFQLNNGSGNPLGPSDTANMDLHQLGAGFYGHTFFTHTRNDSSNDLLGVWTPSLTGAGWYDIQAFVPAPGATTTYAPYQIWTSSSASNPDLKVINQNNYSNQWVDLGKHYLQPGATVKLHSYVAFPDGGDLAYTGIMFIPASVDDSQSVDTGTTSTYSPLTFKGWGTSLAWWANMAGGWSAADRQTAEQELFLPATSSTYGNYRLGLTVLRYNIGASPSGSGPPPGCAALPTGRQIPSPKQSATGNISLSNDTNQVTILNEADTMIKGAGATPHYEAFANSPPWWMTVSQCASGNTTAGADNLSPSQYSAYANYLAGVVSAFAGASHPIVFDTVEPFNEPAGTTWPGSPLQEGDNFVPASQDSFLTQLCSQALGATQISAPDDNSVDFTITDWNAYSPSHQSCVAQINTHGYSNGTSPYAGINRGALYSKAKNASKRLWQSEFGNGKSSSQTDLDSAMTTSMQIAKDLQYLRPEAWITWQAIEGPGGWGMLQANVDSNGNYIPPVRATPRYWALAQYSQFIHPSYVVYRVHDPAVNDSLEQNFVYTVAAKELSTGKVVIVTNNIGSSDSSLNLDLSALGVASNWGTSVYQTSANGWLVNGPTPYLNGSSLQAYQPAQSITTFIVSPPGVPAAPAGPRMTRPQAGSSGATANVEPRHGGIWTEGGQSISFEGHLLPLPGACVRRPGQDCLDSHGGLRAGVVCNVTGALGQPEIDVWINGMLEFEITSRAVDWSRGREDLVSATGVLAFSGSEGARVDALLDGHRLIGTVRC